MVIGDDVQPRQAEKLEVAIYYPNHPYESLMIDIITSPSDGCDNDSSIQQSSQLAGKVNEDGIEQVSDTKHKVWNRVNGGNDVGKGPYRKEQETDRALKEGRGSTPQQQDGSESHVGGGDGGMMGGDRGLIAVKVIRS